MSEHQLPIDWEQVYDALMERTIATVRLRLPGQDIVMSGEDMAWMVFTTLQELSGHDEDFLMHDAIRS